MLLPSPEWLNSGNNAWQLAAATFVGLQSIPGLTILYGGIVKKKWAINSAFMSMYAFSAVLLVWVLWAYNMGFGEQWFPFVVDATSRWRVVNLRTCSGEPQPSTNASCASWATW